MSADQTEIHDTHTCPCEMCVWARQTAANKPKSPSEASSEAGMESDLQNIKTASSPVYGSGNGILAPTFTEEWESAPRWATRTTEIESAQYWFLRGGQAKEIELTGVINEDLKEIRRVAGERLQR